MANKTQIIRTLAARSFSAQAAPQAAVANSNTQSQVCQLPNNAVVASVENNSPIARVSIVFRGGSRNETYDNLGATHLLRTGAGLTNRRSTAFGLTRNIQRTGGNLSCTTDRELVEYNLELTRDQLENGLEFLADVATQHVFKPWEVDAIVPQVRADLARVTPQVRAVDLVHRAAFRRELGNSIFCAKHHLGKLSSETLQHYAAQNLTADRAAIVGVGVDHQQLLGFAKTLQLPNGSGAAVVPAKYAGFGELRVDKAGQWAHVAVATEGGALSNEREALAFALLQQVAGAGPVTKRGNAGGALGKAVTAALGADAQFGFSALNASYSDAGLFGFVLSSEAANAGKGIDAALKALKQGSVAEADVKRAKEQLKSAVLHELDSGARLVSDIGAQAALLGGVKSPAEIVAAIEAVTTADVNAAAKKVASGKWSIGAVGNLAHVPHTNQLN